MDIGHRIRELREARELTVRVLSDRTGLAENSIARIERGERMPGATSVEAIARGLGVAPGELFEEPALAGKGEAPLPLEVAETPGRGYLAMLLDSYTGIFSDLSEGHGPRIANLSEDLPPSRSLAAYQWVAEFTYTCELIEYQLTQNGVMGAVISLLDRADDGEDIPADLLRKARDFQQAWVKLLVEDWASARKWVESQLERPEVMAHSSKNKQEAEERLARETGTDPVISMQDYKGRTRAAAAG